ncbi:MAG: LacI family DNA-binding transcriptional regulator [Humibacter sp.]
MSDDEATAGRPSRATLAEVAALAQVSVATVSKVLNGRAGVSAETRKRVESLLGDRNYNRRSTPQAGAPLLEVLCYEIDSPFGAAAIASIEKVSREQHAGMVVSAANEDHRPPEAWVDGVLRRQPLGVILVASELETGDAQRLRSRGIPMVMIDPYGSPASDAPSIGSADWNGGFLATQHLIELGHTDIAIITGPDSMMASTARLSGYRAALDAAHLPIRPEYIRSGRFHQADGVLGGRELLSLPEPPTAIFATSDLHALGIYEAVRALGKTIPGDVSVVGYDDLAIAKWAGPPLTTIRVPLATMAEQATHLVTRLRHEPELAFSRVELATSLVVRESTAPPRR